MTKWKELAERLKLENKELRLKIGIHNPIDSKQDSLIDALDLNTKHFASVIDNMPDEGSLLDLIKYFEDNLSKRELASMLVTMMDTIDGDKLFTFLDLN